MKKIVLALSVLAILFTIGSCKKDNSAEQSGSVTYPNYSRFSVGSYWIYQRFTVDSAGNSTPLNIFDSCYVEKDTLINNKSYLKTIRPNPTNPGEGFTVTRDSLHYIVDAAGKIVFSSNDFQTIFNSYYFVGPQSDTVCLVESQMTDKNVSITTPAGNFTTCDFRSTFSMYPSWSHAGKTRYLHTRYSENIGIVAETFPFFVSSPSYTERQLVRFHLN
jgi:hypothetical protein